MPWVVVPPAPAFDAVLAGMHERVGVDTLPAHLETAHGITVAKLQQLDVGVFRVDRVDHGPTLVARLFSAARAHAAAEADLAVLRYLADIGFPAERPVAERPLSIHDGQSVLVTEFVRGAPRAKRPAYPIVTLGRVIGRLHTLPVPPAADRAAGALHHFAQGTMADELRAAAGWLDAVEARVPSAGVLAFDRLRAEVAAADGGGGLPEGFVHPDPVPKNAIFTAGGPVLIDWTSAGRGPRLASMTLVLRSGWAAVPFMKGYTRKISLDAAERERLAGLLFSRALIDLSFRVCLDPGTTPSAARKAASLRRESETKARELLAAVTRI